MRSKIRPEVQTVINRVKDNDPDLLRLNFHLSWDNILEDAGGETHQIVLSDEEKAYRMKLTSEEIDLLFEALETNNHVNYLSLGSNKLNISQASVLSNILDNNKVLTGLEIDVKRSDIEVFEVLAESLKRNLTLSYLAINCFNAPMPILKLFAKVFEENKTLSYLTGIISSNHHNQLRTILYASLENNWALIGAPYAGRAVRRLAERNAKLDFTVAQMCADLLEGQRKVEVADPDSRATIFSQKNLSILSVEMHRLACVLPLTFWDFQKLNQGGYAALKYILNRRYNLIDTDINFIVMRLKELEPHIYVRDVVLAGRSQAVKKHALEQIFGHHSSLGARIDVLAAGTPYSGFRILTDEALKDLGLEERISKGVQFFKRLINKGLSLATASAVGEDLDSETKIKLLESRRALHSFLKALKTAQDLPHNYSSLAETALQTSGRRKKETIIEGVAGQSTQKARVGETSKSSTFINI
jgi:hypothetical protein